MNLALLTIILLYVVNVYSLQPNNKIYERIITNLTIINGIQGVSINYNRYNETPSDLSFTSVPGCPKAIDGLPWVYFGNPGRCFLAGQKGPCDDKQVLLINLGSVYGTCGCECLDIVLQEMPNGPYKYCKIKDEFGFGYVYDTKRKKCYTNGRSQGPCKDGSVVFQTFDGHKLDCTPLCSSSNDILTQNNCLGPWGGGSLGKIDTKIECEPDQKYSRILRKCIPNLKPTLSRISK